MSQSPKFLLLFLLGLNSAVPLTAFSNSVNDPAPACVPQSQQQSVSQTTTCDATWNGVLFNILDSQINADVDLLYSGRFVSTGYPYMDNVRLAAFLRTLDADAGQNEFHQGWKDLQLGFNYFHTRDTTQYYGTFGTSNNMLFTFGNTPVSERNHIDIYLNHKDDNIGADFYPAHSGGGQPYPDKKEDGDPNVCDEYSDNAVQAGAGHRGVRGTGSCVNNYCIDYQADSTWYLGGHGTNVRINHETQHLFRASRGLFGADGWGFPNETFSMGNEYLSGAGPRDAERPVYNTVYDWSLVQPATLPPNYVGLAYGHWYLWMAYLSQQFPGDTTKVEDDLLYRYTHYIDSTGVFNNRMFGLARVLDGAAYSSLGGSGSRPGDERLRNLFHNYSLAKWIDNPSPTYQGGRLGFSRSVDPSKLAFFDNSFNPCDRYTAVEVPPKHRLGTSRVNADTTIGPVWQITYGGQGSNCSANRTSYDTVGVWLYGSDYIQLEADPAIEGGSPKTLHFRMKWAPDSIPGTGTLNSLRVSALTYPLRSDSLYLYGTSVTGIIDGYVDPHGFCDLYVPNFGGATKSVVVVIDLGEVTGSFIGYNGRRLPYTYSFKLNSPSVATPWPLKLTATRSTGQSYTTLQWTDTGSCGSGGYTIQRSTNTLGNFVTLATVPLTTFQRNDTIAVNQLAYYRAFATGAPACSSNYATIGGSIEQSQTIRGNLYLSGDLTVGPATTMDVAPGTIVRCRANGDSRAEGMDTTKVEVRVFGTLTSYGTATDSIRWTSDASSPQPGDWRGLYLWMEGNGQLDYNVITHAVHGVQVDFMGSATLQRSSIRHSQWYGVYAFNYATAHVRDCILEQNHGAEFAAHGYSTGHVRTSFLHYSPALGSGSVDDGVVYNDHSTGYFRRNRVAGVGMGLYCLTYADPRLVGEDTSPDSAMYGRNDFLDFRNYGVRAYDEGNPWLGLSNTPTDWQAGRNNLFSLTYPTAIWIKNEDVIQQISAKQNYWGAVPPDASRFLGNVIGPQNSSWYLTKFEASAGPRMAQYYQGYNAAPPLTRPEQLFRLAESAGQAGKVEEAIATYRSIIEEYPSDPLAQGSLSGLLRLQGRRGKIADEVSFLEAIIKSGADPSLVQAARRAQPGVLARAGMHEASRQAYGQLLDDRAFEKSAILFELAVTEGLVMKDIVRSREAVTRLQSISKDYFVLKNAQAMLQEALGKEVWAPLPPLATASPVEASSLAGRLLLAQNSPNPFNPSTTIAFNLPSAGNVSIRLFDVQGRLVRTLLESRLEAGPHEVRWDGRDSKGTGVASGVYHCSLDVGGKRLIRKVTLLR